MCFLLCLVIKSKNKAYTSLELSTGLYRHLIRFSFSGLSDIVERRPAAGSTSAKVDLVCTLCAKKFASPQLLPHILSKVHQTQFMVSFFTCPFSNIGSHRNCCAVVVVFSIP